jgi:long-chain fatty acid transport protein
VAGADDPGALWYNPAGLAWSGEALLLDATLTFFEVRYARIDGGGQPQPEVTGRHAYVPIPTLAGSFRLPELPEWTFGAGLFAPNAALMDWPDTTADGGPAPQRYSVLGLDGSLLATAAVGAAWQPLEELSLGLAAHLLFGRFRAEVALSACDGALCAFPEDPDYDAVTVLDVPVVYPVFVLGATVDLGLLRLAASVQTPFEIGGTSSIQVRTPRAAAYQDARVVNRRDGCPRGAPCAADTVSETELDFPWSLRFGAELRPVDGLRVEAAVVVETWSNQDALRVQPREVWIEDALGFRPTAEALERLMDRPLEKHPLPADAEAVKDFIREH